MSILSGVIGLFPTSSSPFDAIEVHDVGLKIGNFLLRELLSVAPVRHEKNGILTVRYRTMLDNTIDVCGKHDGFLFARLGSRGLSGGTVPSSEPGFGTLSVPLGAVAGLTIRCIEDFALFPVSDDCGGFAGRALFAEGRDF